MGERSCIARVVPAKAGTQWRSYKRHWIPAFAGMTILGILASNIVAVTNESDTTAR
jgi:hypothetical protein